MTTPPPEPAHWENPFIEKLVDSIVINELRISPSGDKIAYITEHFGSERDKKKSSVWLADVGVPGSSRQLDIKPLCHNHLIKWSPNGELIAFLSNINEESYRLYGVQVSDFSKEAILLKTLHKQTSLAKDDPLQNVSKFEFSPDSKKILFLAPEVKDADEKIREEAGDDVEVFGRWNYARPYVVDFDSFEATKLYNKNAQVDNFAWSPDGTKIVLVIHQTPELDSPFYSGIRFETVSLESSSTSSPTLLAEFPGPVLGTPVWTKPSEIFFLRDPHSSSEGKKEELVLYSEKEAINEWDAKVLDDGGCVLAISKSNTLNPLELYTVKIKGLPKKSSSIEDIKNLEVTEEGNVFNLPLNATNLTQITHHNQHLADAFDLEITSKVIGCKSEDETTDLDAIFIAPTFSHPKPLPTCVFIHGGAYDRATFAFNSNSNYHHWQALLLSLFLPSSNASYNSQPIAFLSPNYRGGSGRGEKFASWTHGRVGTVEYEDIITLINKGIQLGLVDPERIIIGGWSQGGIESYLLATRRNIEAKLGEWKIRGAICGAGGTDLDMLVMSSDRPYLQGEGIGGPPWNAERDNRIAENASAVLRLKRKGAAEAMPRVLILHGKEDKRLPVSQALAFREACAGYGVEDKVEMAVYPREGHILGERAHLADVLARVERFCSGLLS
ncbi:alpha/beta-hydrolase, partial [Hyaloscypha variabilis F]